MASENGEAAFICYVKQFTKGFSCHLYGCFSNTFTKYDKMSTITARVLQTDAFNKTSSKSFKLDPSLKLFKLDPRSGHKGVLR